MQLSMPTPHKTIDLSGLRCPHLVVATMKALRSLECDQILQVIATDLNSPSNMAAWSRQSGHELLELYDEDGRFCFFFKRGKETAVSSVPLEEVIE